MWFFKKKTDKPALRHSCKPVSVKHLRTPSGCKVWVYCACGEAHVYKKANSRAEEESPGVHTMERFVDAQGAYVV